MSIDQFQYFYNMFMGMMKGIDNLEEMTRLNQYYNLCNCIDHLSMLDSQSRMVHMYHFEEPMEKGTRLGTDSDILGEETDNLCNLLQLQNKSNNQDCIHHMYLYLNQRYKNWQDSLPNRQNYRNIFLKHKTSILLQMYKNNKGIHNLCIYQNQKSHQTQLLDSLERKFVWQAMLSY